MLLGSNQLLLSSSSLADCAGGFLTVAANQYRYFFQLHQVLMVLLFLSLVLGGGYTLVNTTELSLVCPVAPGLYVFCGFGRTVKLPCTLAPPTVILRQTSSYCFFTVVSNLLLGRIQRNCVWGYKNIIVFRLKNIP